MSLRPYARHRPGTIACAVIFAAGLVIAEAAAACAQTAPSPPGSSSNPPDDWTFAVYPVLAWVPTNISVDLNIPPLDGGGGLHGSIDDSHLDGAFLAGVAASKGRIRLESQVMWAAFGGDRINLPQFSVDVHAVYGYGSIGVRVAPDFYVTGGVRRLALKYDIDLETTNRQRLERKPGLWDPVVGVSWHRVKNRLELHALAEGGGFGVGSDSEFSAGGRIDWKFARHFGLTGGYGYLRFKVSDDVAGKVLVATQTLHGPVFAFGIYF